MSAKEAGRDKNGKELRPGQKVKFHPLIHRLHDFVGRVTWVGDWISRVRDNSTGDAYPCFNSDIEIQ